MGKAYRPKSATQRQGANAREKFRNIDINSAYETLISKIQPALNATQLNELPKVKRLQLAIHYIKYLEGVLGQEHEYKENPQNLLQQFQDQALEVIRKKNTYTAMVPAENERFQKHRKVGGGGGQGQAPHQSKYSETQPRGSNSAPASCSYPIPHQYQNHMQYPSAQSVNCGYPAGMLPSFSFTSEDWNQISPVYPEYQSPNGYSSQ